MTEAVVWADLEQAAEALVHVWSHNGDVEWLRASWGLFEKRGLSKHGGSGIGRTRVLVRFLALGHLYWDWASRSAGERTEIGADFLDVLDMLELHALFVGQVLGADAHAENEFGEPDVGRACVELSVAERQPLVSELEEAYGGTSGLFVSLWRSNRPGGSDEDESADEILNGDVSPDKGAGYEWVADGCPVVNET